MGARLRVHLAVARLATPCVFLFSVTATAVCVVLREFYQREVLLRDVSMTLFALGILVLFVGEVDAVGKGHLSDPLWIAILVKVFAVKGEEFHTWHSGMAFQTDFAAGHSCLFLSLGAVMADSASDLRIAYSLTRVHCEFARNVSLEQVAEILDFKPHDAPDNKQACTNAERTRE